MFEHADHIKGGKRLGLRRPEWMGDDWFTSWSPRNDNEFAEGQWCHWVHLARLILSDARTAEQMPDHFVPYEDPQRLYDEHHPDCARRT